jgi:opacity protein-like surface antigen
MRTLFLASAAAVTLMGGAYAAEPLPPIAPPPPPMVEPFFVPTWAGPYIGADIGWGWADAGGGFFGFDNHNHGFGRFDDDDDLDGLVGGVFAGWLGQNGTFLYGVELFGQLADIDRDDDEFWRRHRDRFEFDSGHCWLDGVEHIDCPLAGRKVHGLAGLEAMIGWGGDRTAFLLHAGPALGWFKRDDDFSHVFVGLSHDDDDDIELGLSVAAEARFKLTERVFAGVIGRALWFPDVGDDNGIGVHHNGANGHVHRWHSDDNDVTVFEVKARLGMTFGVPPAAAPAF